MTYEASAVTSGAFATVNGVSGQSVSEPRSGPRRLMQVVPIPVAGTSESGAIDPYTSTADALNEAVLDAQIGRLNPLDQTIVRRRLGLAIVVGRHVVAGDSNRAETLLYEERALGKLRHPSVLRPLRNTIAATGLA
jgi:hypothetical protein